MTRRRDEASYWSMRIELADGTALAGLTASEREIAIALTRGWSSASLARHRGVSAATIANQIASVFDKLAVHSRTELAGKLANVVLGSPVASTPARRRSRSSPTARVLVVEDTTRTREEVVRALEDVGYVVSASADLESARRLRSEHPPDVVLGDVRLGPESGLSLLEDGLESPIVLMSGAAELDEALRGLALGAWDFVDKAWGVERIRLAVGEALAGARAPRVMPEAVTNVFEVAPDLVAASLIAGQARFVGAIEHERARHVLFARTTEEPLDARARFAMGRMLRLVPTKAIGFELRVSEVTAWTILHDAIEQLGFGHRIEAVACLAPLAPWWSDAMVATGYAGAASG